MYTSLPFEKADMERPADEGRSLHDEVSTFIREILQLPTPVTERSIYELQRMI